jgi:putative transposase
MFLGMIRYKQEWSGGSVKLVRAAYSSQECTSCGHIDATSRRGEVFCCTKCGHTDHADINAAKVLLRRANRSALPVEGELPEGALRSRKVKVGLRVPRRRSLQSSGL